MSTRTHFDILRCRDAESDSCDILLWRSYASAERQIERLKIILDVGSPVGTVASA
jgi:hypothetical protein